MWQLCTVMIFGSFIVVNGDMCQTAGEFCSQVNEICSNQGQISSQFPRVGKSGPPGIKGDPGEPGIVNYTAIEEKMQRKFQEMEHRIDAKIENHKRMTNDKIESEARKTAEVKQDVENLKRSDCSSASQDGAKSWNGSGGVFQITPNVNTYEVYCDISNHGNTWTVIQRRQDGSENFQRNWFEYVNGFGNRDGEFWLGLEAIHRITQSGEYILRIELMNWSGQTRYAEYGSFFVGSAETKYRLSIGGYSGNAGDSLAYHNNNKFSTPDRDNDQASGNCASGNGGGWWFNGCDHSNLNGIYHVGGTYSGDENGVEWERWNHGGKYSMKRAVMKIRPNE